MIKRFNGSHSNDKIMSNSSTKNNLRLVPDYQLPDIDCDSNSRQSKQDRGSSKDGSSLAISRIVKDKIRSKSSLSFAIQNSSVLIGYKFIVIFIILSRIYRITNLNSTIKTTILEPKTLKHYTSP